MSDHEPFPDLPELEDGADGPDPGTGPKPAKSRRRRRIALRAALPAALALLVFFVSVDRSIVHRFAERKSSLPSRTYAAPFRLARGDRADAADLTERLVRLGYRAAGRDPERPGEFRRRGSRWTLHLRTGLFPQGEREGFPVEFRLRRDRVRGIVDLRDGSDLESFELEPEQLFTFYADVMESRRWTPLSDVPTPLIQAIQAVEDRRFRRHHGIDLIGIGRATFENVRAGGIVQGGSTITQQLAKNLYGPGRRSLRRKVLEATAAVALELHYSKEEILEAYLNEVYLGQLGPVAISGVGDASQFFFGTHVRDLDLPRSALLAGMIRNPGGYNPRRHLDEARGRRDVVLQLMVEQGLIDETRAASARAAPLGLADAKVEIERLPWIESYLVEAVEPLTTEAVPSRAGFSAFTTFDQRVQDAAEAALRAGLERLERRLGPGAGDPLEGAVVVLRPADGALLALVGGRDYRRSQFNRAIQARRPPGSTMKPFVYLAALERARRDADFEFTLATLLEDTPLEMQSGGRPWKPRNFDEVFRGAVTARQALEQSINVPTVRAALEVGLPAVVEMAERCGIESRLEAVPSLALGSEEVTPLELAGAYAALANGGRRIRPHALLALLDRAGQRAPVSFPPAEKAVGPDAAFLITDVLAGAILRGTGRSAAALGWTGTAAGKTGTSDDLRDAWFVGYTTEVLALVWVGYDDNRPVGLTGAAAALPIWVDLMRRIGAEAAPTFRQPSGVVRRTVDLTTGQRATYRCPRTVDELFLRGTEPVGRCERHGGWRTLFRASRHLELDGRMTTPAEERAPGACRDPRRSLACGPRLGPTLARRRSARPSAAAPRLVPKSRSDPR